MSIGLRVSDSEVLFSEFNGLKEINAFQSFIKNFKSLLLYSDANSVTNLLFSWVNTRKALSNGFEIQLSDDLGLSTYIYRKGDRKGKDNTTFNFNIFRT